MTTETGAQTLNISLSSVLENLVNSLVLSKNFSDQHTGTKSRSFNGNFEQIG